MHSEVETGTTFLKNTLALSILLPLISTWRGSGFATQEYATWHKDYFEQKAIENQ